MGLGMYICVSARFPATLDPKLFRPKSVRPNYTPNNYPIPNPEFILL